MPFEDNGDGLFLRLVLSAVFEEILILLPVPQTNFEV
jgi:hypothetical protein